MKVCQPHNASTPVSDAVSLQGLASCNRGAARKQDLRRYLSGDTAEVAGAQLKTIVVTEVWVSLGGYIRFIVSDCSQRAVAKGLDVGRGSQEIRKTRKDRHWLLGLQRRFSKINAATTHSKILSSLNVRHV